MLVDAEAALRRQPGLRTTRARYAIQREEKLFLSTEGADVAQKLSECGGGIAAEATGDGELQIRTYPDGLRFQNSGGWECLADWDLVGNAPRIAEQAVALLTAKTCPQDVRTTVILTGNQLSLQCHESCGHPIELDRVLGSEAAMAGTSFLTTDRLGSFRYGSEHINIKIDSTSRRGLGTFAYDDEGVPASDGWAVKDGVFVGYLMNRETAAALGTGAFHGALRDEKGGHLDPYRLALGIARAAERAGAALYEETAARRILPGSPTVVEAAHGRVRARYVIFATDDAVPMDGLALPRLSVPILSLVVATEPLGRETARILPGGECAADTRFEVSYWRKTGDGRLVFGGGEAAAGRLPADIGARVRPHLARAYPQLAGVGVAHAWAGIVPVTANRLPYVLEAAPGIWAAGGYSGQGLALAPMVGKLIADRLLGESPALDLIAGIAHRRLPDHPLLHGPLVRLGLALGRLRDRW